MTRAAETQINVHNDKEQAHSVKKKILINETDPLYIKEMRKLLRCCYYWITVRVIQGIHRDPF